MKRVAASYLYTLDGNEPVRNGFVETEDDGTVIRTGICEDISSEKVFYEGGALVPGFVNTHCHLELSHLQGKFRKHTGMAGFIDQINSLRDSEERETKIKTAASWMSRMWDAGVSAMADISNCNDTFALKASSKMYTRTFIEVFGSEPEDCKRVMSSALELQSEARNLGLDVSVTPHSCYTMSPELVSASSASGLRDGYISYHSQESAQEEEMMISGTGELADNRRRYGMSMPPVTGKPSLMYFIDRLKKVSQAPFDAHILLVHNVLLSEEEAKSALEAMKNVYWAICPLSNRFINDAVPPVDLMRKLGLKITMGTDSLSSNDTLDMVSEMYAVCAEFSDVTLGETLVWACRNGAEFLSLGHKLGSILPGKCPGIVLIDALGKNGELTERSFSKRLI